MAAARQPRLLFTLPHRRPSKPPRCRFLFHEASRPTIVTKRSTDILHDPWFNKGTAFPLTERERLDLRGLLPPRILIDNIQQFAPIVYTPTVGLVCQNYSGLFRRPRGMYFSAADRGEMMQMVYNWPANTVDMIVVTDGRRILGLGDLGVQGIGISIGKLDLYVAAAGINPQRVLPIMIDVGTNNKKLLENPLYLGLQQPRLEGDEYLSVIDEFMEAVYTRWPRVIVQFEDFQTKWAFKLLARYRDTFRMFNDDIQGTAGVAVAGMLGAVRVQGLPMSDFPKQKIVVVGAGSAGIGVITAARKTMARMCGDTDSALNEASKQFWLVDKMGLVTKQRMEIDLIAEPFARDVQEANNSGLREGASLAEVVNAVKPDVLLGLSGVGGIFNKEVLEGMCHSSSSRPAIFAMSNPTENAECTAEEAFHSVGPHIIYASGSPFKDVDLGNNKRGHSNQGNNMYLFPGIGLGTLVSGAQIVSDGMLQAAAECLAGYMREDELLQGKIFPCISNIREITKAVAAAVVREAIREGHTEGYRDKDSRDMAEMSEADILRHVEQNMWVPAYSPLVTPS